MKHQATSKMHRLVDAKPYRAWLTTKTHQNTGNRGSFLEWPKLHHPLWKNDNLMGHKHQPETHSTCLKLHTKCVENLWKTIEKSLKIHQIQCKNQQKSTKSHPNFHSPKPFILLVCWVDANGGVWGGVFLPPASGAWKTFLQTSRLSFWLILQAIWLRLAQTHGFCLAFLCSIYPSRQFFALKSSMIFILFLRWFSL